MIQQGVSVGGVADPSSAMSGSERETTGDEMTIGKVMDWIEARLEAVKSREEEEDEDEEKERSRSGNNTAASAASVSTSKPSATAKSGTPDNVATTSRHKDHVRRIAPSTPNLPTDQFSQHHRVTLPPTPHSPLNPRAHLPSHSPPASPSPPSTPLHTIRSLHNLPSNRPSKARVTFPSAVAADSVKFRVGAAGSGVSAEDTYGMDFVGAGAKRRHSVMMMLDSTSSPVDLSIGMESSPGSTSHPPTNMNTGSGATSTITPSGRRRTRSARGSHNHGHVQTVHANGNQQSVEAMDVEEDGRERKRVARR
jgi:hypothetical protein